MSSYFIGNDESQWVSGAPHYGEVRYESLYEGIDAIFYGNQSRLQYDFIVAPHADPNQIQLKIDPAERVELADNGDLQLHIGDIVFTMQAPYSYQMIGGAEREIASEFTLDDDGMVRFALGDYDPSHTLIIDPLVYSTYMGGTFNDISRGIAVDGAGNVTVTGQTASSNFPTTAGAFQTTNAGNWNVFVSKLNATETALVYSTYLSGTGDDYGRGIALDGAGNATITGQTTSSDYPTTAGAFQTTNAGNSDAFVSKLNATGTALVYSTYLGGGDNDYGYGIALDGVGNAAYITGYTDSTNFPTTAGSFQTTYAGGGDVFVTKLNATGTALVYSTYLGGTGVDYGYGIAVDGADNATITGYTLSGDYPTTAGSFQTTYAGNSDAFVSKLNATGTALDYSTYLGGGDNDYGYGIALDSAGNATITGYTNSTNFPTTAGSFQTTNAGSNDVFVSKLNATGTGLVYSTYLGGTGSDIGRGIALDGTGNATITGQTTSNNYPTTAGAYDVTANGNWDAFVSKLNPLGTALVYSTHVGGTSNDFGYGIALDSAGNATITGQTTSTNYPTTAGAFQTTIAGSLDSFVTKLNLATPVTVTLEFDPATSNTPEATGMGNILRVTTSDSNATASAVTVDVAVTGGTATAADYNLTGTITIPAGTAHNTSVSIASGFTVTDDILFENDETVELTLSNPTGAVLGAQTTHTHTIENDETAVLTASGGSSLSVDEGVGMQDFVFRLDMTATTAGTPTMAIAGSFDVSTVEIVAANGATSGVDYTAITSTTTPIPAGTTDGATYTFPVTITDDSVVERSEFFDFAMSNPVAVSLTTLNTAAFRNRFTIRILDNDSATVSWQTATSNVAESTTPHTVDAVLTINANPASPTAELGYPVTVNVSQTPNTATTPADYTVTTSQLDFAAGANSGDTQPVSITIADDTLVEGDETFSPTVGNVFLGSTATVATSIGFNVTSTGTHTTTIADNDAEFSIASNQTNIAEGTATANSFTFTVTRTGANQLPASVDLGYTGATDGTDFSFDSVSAGTFTGGTLNFPANTASITVTYNTIPNAIDQADRTLTITLSNPTIAGTASLATATADTTIDDDDAAGVTVSPNTGLVTTEAGGTATFDVALTSQPTANVTINLASTDTGEGTVSPASVTFTTANWNVAQTVTITGQDDAIADGNIAYTITTTMVAGSDTTYNAINPDDVSVTNNDNEVASITVSPTTVSIAEGSTTATFDVSANTPPANDVTIALTTDAQCSVSPTSVTLLASGTTAVTVTVTATDDATVEGDHTCAITTGDPTSTDGFYDALGAGDVADVSANVADNDAEFSIASNQTNIAEGTATANSFTFTVTRTGANQLPASVDLGYTGATDGTDFSFDSVSAGTFTGGTLNFPANTASITVTYNTIPNAIDQANRTLTITLSNPTIAGTASLATATADTTIDDDDAAGVTVSPNTGLVTTEAGGTATFDVALTSQPTANVVINLASTDTGEGTVAPASVTFTTANWNVAQTVTITGQDDAVVDGNIAYTITTTMVAGSDTTYNAINPDDVSVTNNDNDAAGVTVSPNTGLVTNEAGGTATFDVALTSQPTANVVINLASTDTGEGTVAPASVTFTTANWNVAQTVTITGQDDAITDGNIAYTITTTMVAGSDTTYNAINPDDVSVTNNDNEVASITVSPTTVSIAEGSTTATFDVSANTPPANDVTIALTTDAQCSVAPTSVTLLAGNTNAITVTVTAVDDTAVEGDHTCAITTGDPTSTDGFYDALGAGDVADVSANVADNDAEFSIASNQTNIAEGTATANSFTFTVTRTGANQLPASVDLGYTGATDGTDFSFDSVSAGTFTGGTLNFPANTASITVTYNTIPNATDQANRTLTITLSNPTIAGTASLATATADTTIDDDDTVGITANPNAGLVTTEAGGTATFDVTLNTQPDADVILSVTSDTPAEGTVSPTTLTFTSANWNVAQTVTVTGQDDAVADGNIAYTVTVALNSTSDTTGYASVPNEVANVTNNDNDTVGITANPNAGLVTTEAGGTATFDVTLNTQPDADVILSVTSDTPAEGTVAPATLTFTSADWDTPQTVTITGQDDAVADGNIAYTVTVALNSTTDTTGYASVANEVANVTNNDNDTPGITVNPNAGLVTTEAGGTVTFDVTLNTQPDADVILSVTSDDTTEGTVSPTTLTFTDADWDTPQTVTITGVDDSDLDGNIAYTVTVALDSTADTTGYASVPDAVANVTNDDDEVPPPATADEAASDATEEPNFANDPAAWDIQITSSTQIIISGQRVDFIITVRKLLGGTPVQVDFPVPDGFTILSATSNRGAVTTNGQLVTYTDDIHVGEVGVTTIITQAGANAQAGTSQACIITPVTKCASLSLARVTELPATGETPAWIVQLRQLLGVD